MQSRSNEGNTPVKAQRHVKAAIEHRRHFNKIVGIIQAKNCERAYDVIHNTTAATLAHLVTSKAVMDDCHKECSCR